MIHSTKEARPRIVRAVVLATALSTTLAALGACAKGGRSDYREDADTGAAAPATRPTIDNPAAPNSTTGVSERTGTRGPAGDTLGATGKAKAGTNPTTTGQAPARKP